MFLVAMRNLAVPGKAFAAALVTLLLASGAGAAVYVAADAPGPVHNGASWNTAFTTITAAVNSLAYGGDVWIKAGIYRECLAAKSYVNLYGGFLGFETSTSQRLIGAFPTIVDARQQGSAISVPYNAWVTIDGLTLRRGRTLNGGGVFCDNSSVVKIRNCRIEDCRATICGGGVYWGKYTTGEMTDCFITGCTAPNGGGGVVEYHSYPVWRRVEIARNHATASGGGLHCPGHSGADLGNCTLVCNTAGSTGGAVQCQGSGSVTINNCVISGNCAPSGGGLYGANVDGQLTFSHCDFWQNDGGDWAGTIPTPPPTAGSFFADPLFVKPDYDEYRLMPGSPCSGVGAYPLDTVVTVDRIGVAKMLDDGVQVRLSGKIVSCADGATTYIQEPDRASAIAVTGLFGFARSDIVSSVTGTLSTNPMGVRVLNASSSSIYQYGRCDPRPVAARPSWLPSALGLYARTWGRVTGVATDGFSLTDGTNGTDRTDGTNGLYVRLPGNNVAIGDFVCVTGVYTANGDFRASGVQLLSL